MYTGAEDSPLNDFVSYLAGAALVGYGVATWQKLKPNSMVPGLVSGGVGLVTFGARHYVHRPMPKAIMEAVGYSTGGYLGQMVGANTVTIGGIAPGALAMNRLPATSSAGAVREKVNGVIDARRRGGGNPPPPPPRRAAFEVEY